MKKEVKLWQPIAGFLLTIVISKLNDAYLFPNLLWEILYEIIPFLYMIWIVMLFYVILRNTFRAIKGAITKPKEP